jgi:glyoxylase-like metal-dependent hydrolase (beta-lactamase superfamily II)
VGERWIEVANGVFARRCAQLDQTIGLVAGEDRCLVVDTGPDEVQGAELAAAIRKITRLPWTVLITHAHWDHFFGTAAFAPCAVIAHQRCREDMAAGAGRQRETQARLYQEEGEPELAQRLAAARLVAPTQVMDTRLEVDLGGRSVELIHPGRGHTSNDVVVRTGDVLFAGDLVEQGAPPWIGPDAYPLEWPSTMDELLALGPAVVVPGHGEPVSRQFVATQRDELAAIAGLLREVQAGRLSVSDALARSPYPKSRTLPVLERGRAA